MKYLLPIKHHLPWWRGGETIVGTDGMKEFVTGLRKGLPDRTYTVEQMVAEGDTVVVWVTIRGTFIGDYMGLPATGKPSKMTEVMFWRVVDGKITERWPIPDRWDLLTSLGAVPTLPA